MLEIQSANRLSSPTKIRQVSYIRLKLISPDVKSDKYPQPKRCKRPGCSGLTFLIYCLRPDVPEQMGLDLQQAKPSVLRIETIRNLDEYLRFRHIVHNVYTLSLNPEREGKLVKDLDPVFDKLSQELLMFAQFLKK